MGALAEDRRREVVKVDVPGDQVERLEDLGRSAVLETESVRQFGEDSPVVQDLGHFVVDHGEIEAPQSVERWSVVVGHEQWPLEWAFHLPGVGSCLYE